MTNTNELSLEEAFKFIEDVARLEAATHPIALNARALLARLDQKEKEKEKVT